MPLPPAEPIEDVLTSSVRLQRPPGGDGDKTVVDDDPHPVETTVSIAAVSVNTERILEFFTVARHSRRHTACHRFLSLTPRTNELQDSNANICLQRLQLISSEDAEIDEPICCNSSGKKSLERRPHQRQCAASRDRLKVRVWR